MAVLANTEITVINKDGKYLFTIGRGSNKRTTSAQNLYDTYKVQWWEPLADNYMELSKVATDITTSLSYKHFTWQQIVDFAEILRSSFSYRSKGSGDWKYIEEGGAKYLLVEIGGKPYWADGVGQIPFAVGTFKVGIEQEGNEEKAITYTLLQAQLHPNGEVFPLSSPLVSNGYDDYFVLRGALWASKRYDSQSYIEKRYVERGMTVEIPKQRAIKSNVNPSASELAKPITIDIAKKYGLKNS